jgi:hypothetical protein
MKTIICITIIIIVCLIVLYIATKKKNDSCSKDHFQQTELINTTNLNPLSENLDTNGNLSISLLNKNRNTPLIKEQQTIYNYFINYNVSIDIIPIYENGKQGKQYTIIKYISPKSKLHVSDVNMWNLFKKSGTSILFYIWDIKDKSQNPNKTLFVKTIIDGPDESLGVGENRDDISYVHDISSISNDSLRSERMKNLHIGMVTSRYIGATSDDQLVVSQAAVSGRPWVLLHNVSNIPLSLNNKRIQIAARGIVRYQGQYHMGVALGTYFNDDNGFYDSFQYLYPATDIYFGVVSDLSQPSFGGWQWEYDDNPTNPMWMMEEGFM